MNKENLLEFGIKRENEERRDGGCAFVFDFKKQKYAVYKNLITGSLGFFGGGFEKDEDEIQGTLRELSEESGLFDFLHVEKLDKVFAHYHNSLKNVNRITCVTGVFVVLKSSNLKKPELENHEKFKLHWSDFDEILFELQSKNSNKDNDHWIYFFKKAVKKAIDLGYDTKTCLEKID